MKETPILEQIKNLDKSVIRSFIIEVHKEHEHHHHPTPTQFQIIGYIIKHQNEDIYQRDLEKVLNLRRATVSGVLQTMEKRKIITRVVSEKDSRTKKIMLNEDAKQAFINGKERFINLEKIIKKDISDEELKNFSNTINKMQKNIEDYNKKEGIKHDKII